MNYQTKCEVIRRLLRKGFIPEAEVACLELKVEEKTFKEIKREVENEGR